MKIKKVLGIIGAAVGSVGAVVLSVNVFNKMVYKNAVKSDENYEKGYYYDWREGKVHVKVAGNGKPVLLLHSLSIGSSHREWSAVFDALSKRYKVYAIDLPGYGYAKVSHAEKVRWAELVEGYFAQDREFALVVQIIDMRHKPTKDDLSMIDFLVQTNMPFIVVLTKKDKLNKTQQAQQLELINSILAEYADGIKTFPFSATKGDGTEEIREFITNCVEEYTANNATTE